MATGSAPRNVIAASERASAARIMNRGASGEPLKFALGIANRAKDTLSHRRHKSAYTPDGKAWAKIASRAPIESSITHALGMSDARFRRAPLPAKSSGRAHKLGFNDSETMPLISEPQKMYDAFQDTSRTGPLPFNLSKGSMPLYFPMNRKYLSEYEHNYLNPPEPKHAWDFRAATQGPFERATEQKHGRALVTPDAEPANSPALEDRSGGRDYLGAFMSERPLFDGTVARARTPNTLRSQATGGARDVGRPGTAGVTTHFFSKSTGNVDVLTLSSSASRPATAASSESRERVRTHTRNVHAIPPVNYDDKVLRDKRSDDFELPEWQVCRSKTKGFPYWYNRVTGESRWLPPEDGGASKSAHVTSLGVKLSREDGNGNDRNWFSYQPGYQADREASSTCRTSYNLQQDFEKHDFVKEEQQGHKRFLQRRYAKTNDTEAQNVRWFGVSHPPAGKSTWEDKLWRLISDKCYTNSGPNYQMRKAFFALDEDRSGSIHVDELGGVLQKWMNLELSEEQLEVVKAKFEEATESASEITYKDLCAVIEEAGHPLGGNYNINWGSVENLYGKCKEKLMSYRVDRDF